MNTGRAISVGAEAWLGRHVEVLDHGHVELVEYLGNDRTVVDAARVSYGKVSGDDERDKKLIAYLFANNHSSPFEQVVTTWRVKMPIFVARQWIRHRTARINEISGRYARLPEECFIPEVEVMCTQSKSSKQCRDESDRMADQVAEDIRTQMAASHSAAHRLYNESMDKGLTLELSRTVLPVAQYTEMYWQMDLSNLFKFLKLRMDPHAQLEFRRYSFALAEVVKEAWPWCWEAFQEYELDAVKFSATEVRALREAVGALIKLKQSLDPMFLSRNIAGALNDIDPFIIIGKSGKDKVAKLATKLGIDLVEPIELQLPDQT